MKPAGWVDLDFILAAVVAILGNVVASYLQAHYELADLRYLLRGAAGGPFGSRVVYCGAQHKGQLSRVGRN